MDDFSTELLPSAKHGFGVIIWVWMHEDFQNFPVVFAVFEFGIAQNLYDAWLP